MIQQDSLREAGPLRAKNIQDFLFVFFSFPPCTVEMGKQSRSISGEQLRALVDCSSSGSVELPDKLKAVVTPMRKEV